MAKRTKLICVKEALGLPKKKTTRRPAIAKKKPIKLTVTVEVKNAEGVRLWKLIEEHK